MLSGIDASSGDTMTREHRRAPPAIGDRPLVDHAARAGRHVTLLAARRWPRLLEGHSALTRRRHGRPPSACPLGWSRSLPSRVRVPGAQINNVIVFISGIN